jgi:hypothetical protein
MSTEIKLKRSAVPSKIPTIEQLNLGELAINTYDGKIFIKKDDGVESIVTIGESVGGIFINADGGDPTTNYGGIDPIDGGDV